MYLQNSDVGALSCQLNQVCLLVLNEMIEFAHYANHMILGDEYHYIFTCSFFSNDRKRYIESKYRKFPSAFNLNSLFNVSDPHLTQLCKFIEIIMRNF